MLRLMESSGHTALDNEALAAVRKAAPYGKLPQAYKENVLNIFAFFQYNLTGKPRIFGAGMIDFGLSP